MARKTVGRKKVVRKKQSTSALHPDWSDSQYWQFIRAGLRAKFTRYPPKWEALSRAKRTALDNPRAKWEYMCANCLGFYVQAKVTVDHIVPCGSLKSYEDLPGFVRRMFCHVDGLQVLCIDCHKAKTKLDREALKDVL